MVRGGVQSGSRRRRLAIPYSRLGYARWTVPPTAMRLMPPYVPRAFATITLKSSRDLVNDAVAALASELNEPPYTLANAFINLLSQQRSNAVQTYFDARRRHIEALCCLIRVETLDEAHCEHRAQVSGHFVYGTGENIAEFVGARLLECTLGGRVRRHRDTLRTARIKQSSAAQLSSASGRLIDGDSRELRRECRAALELMQMFIRSDVGYLDHVLRIVIVAKDAADDTKDALIVVPHYQLQRGEIAGLETLDDPLVGQRCQIDSFASDGRMCVIRESLHAFLLFR